MAKQVTKVHDVYKHLNLDVPADLLELISAESMIELLDGISRALREEKTIIRISGTYVMGHLHGFVFMMFPEDTLVTVNGLIICEGTRKTIIIELDTKRNFTGWVQFKLETLLPSSQQLSLPIKTEPMTEWGMGSSGWSFAWDNWVADLLQLEFLRYGLTCPKELLEAY